MFKAELAGSEQDMVKQAMALVAARGYRVLPAEMGGCCEYLSLIHILSPRIFYAETFPVNLERM